MKQTLVEEFVWLGAVIPVPARPTCFPKLALVGQIFASRQRRNGRLLALSVLTTLVLFTGHEAARAAGCTPTPCFTLN